MAKDPETKKQVVETASHHNALAELDMAALTADAGASVSDMTADDIALPYLSILQALSPQVQPGKAEYIEGAVASMLFNTVSQDVYDGRKVGVLFVPCYYERRYVEWVDRDQGGGFVADYDIDSDIMSFTKKDDKGKARMPTGNLIVETAYHYGLYQDPNSKIWTQCVLTLKSTGLKVNRKWNNELSTTKIPGTELTAPRWLYPYHLTTWLESKKNNSWWQLKVDRVEKDSVPTPVSRAVYDKAKIFHNLAKGGEVKRAVEKELPADDAASSGGGGGHHDDDMPF